MMSAIKAMQKLERIAADTFRESVTTRVEKGTHIMPDRVVLRVAYGEFDLSTSFSVDEIEIDQLINERLRHMAMELGRRVFVKDGQ